MLAADHDCFKVAMRYSRDCEAIKEVNKVYQNPRQALGPWRSPHCNGDETSVKSAQPGAQWQKPLPELVVGFMEKVVGIKADDPQRRSIKYLCAKVMAWHQPRDARKELAQHLRDISQDKTREILTCFAEDPRHDRGTSQAIRPPKLSPPCIEWHGHQHCFSSRVFIAANADENTGDYENKDRQWLLRVNRIAKCFVGCCNSDAERFLARHANKKGNKKGVDFSITTLNKWPKMEGCAACKEEKS